MKSFELKIISPQRSEVFQDVYSVSAESVDGRFTALGDHEPFMIRMNPCIISIVRVSDVENKFFVNSALMRITLSAYTIIAQEFYSIEDVNRDFLSSYYDQNIASKIKKELNL